MHKSGPPFNLIFLNFFLLSNIVSKYEIYKVDLFKDYYLNDNLLSNLKTTNKIINVLAGVYAKDNT